MMAPIHCRASISSIRSTDNKTLTRKVRMSSMEKSQLILSLLVSLAVLLPKFAKCGQETPQHGSTGEFYPDIPPLKTIKSSVGDVIDCIDIYKQPAFSLPSLRNHTIQMKPTSPPLEKEKNASMNTEYLRYLQPWNKDGTCREGTIAILRVSHNKPVSIRKSGDRSSGKAVDGHEYAVMHQTKENYGTTMRMNVWNPQVQTEKMFSLAQLWITNSDEALNTIEAGWQIYPELFGDRQTRLFVYWTRDNYVHTGCHNLLCPGFVQVSKKVTPGAVITPVSTYHGKQTLIKIFVFKDKNRDWWLKYEDELVGYWPASIFTTLASKSTGLEWGGEVANDMQITPHTTTQMGSGHFPSEGGEGTSCFFSNVLYVDTNNKLQLPENTGTLVVPSANCYDVKVAGNTGTEKGFMFFFGGPGRNPKCS